ncbi:MAG: glucose-6-phosphate dehydrogenase [Alphaproteobacteria bacterium]|nr:glucose-6-phosphate dehydrogenase [Alphaproteobacteria bacterium]
MVARVIPVDPFDLVVFGGTGDLARRKLLPALYHRMLGGQALPDSRIIAAARSDLDAGSFRHRVKEALRDHAAPEKLDPERLAAFLTTLDYVRVDAQGEDGWDSLFDRLKDSERMRVFYLSVAPQFFGPISERLATSGCRTPDTRLVVEKPLGRDLESARALNRQLATIFEERQIYRIDHYLGKETVQNLMALRFANALFEPIWNARHVDHVQITVAERVGVGGRGNYYDRNGALRDMMQNHLLQLLCLIAMEPPAHFEPDAVRDEKLKVLRSLKPLVGLGNVVRGQYRGINGEADYLEDVENPGSRTESFVAIKVEIANWRWNGTPFYLRTGKRLRARMSEIAVVFKDAPHSIFPESAGGTHPNVLAIRLQPDEGITLRLTIKEPGPGGMRLCEVPLDMTFAETLGAQGLSIPDAYERLVMDVIRGDQTLFMRDDEVEAAWRWIDPIIASAETTSERPQPYDSYSSGPEDALMLMHRDGRRWRALAA